MATNDPKVSSGRVSLLLSKDDFLNFSETTDSLEKSLDAVREVIKCRADIFMQKKEKHQQILDYQMMILEKEKSDYLKKSEDLMNDMGEKKSHLMQIEHSYFNMKNKLSSEQHVNKILKDKINQLQLESRQKNERFYKTAEIFKTVIKLYENFLNITVNLDEENSNIVTVTFKEKKKAFEGAAFIKLEILNEGKVKVVKMNPTIELKNGSSCQVFQGHEIILFLNKFRSHLLQLD